MSRKRKRQKPKRKRSKRKQPKNRQSKTRQRHPVLKSKQPRHTILREVVSKEAQIESLQADIENERQNAWAQRAVVFFCGGLGLVLLGILFYQQFFVSKVILANDSLFIMMFVLSIMMIMYGRLKKKSYKAMTNNRQVLKQLMGKKALDGGEVSIVTSPNKEQGALSIEETTEDSTRHLETKKSKR